MANLIVITFGNVKEAEQVRDDLGKLEDQHTLRLDDSAIIVKDKDGRYTLPMKWTGAPRLDW